MSQSGAGDRDASEQLAREAAKRRGAGAPKEIRQALPSGKQDRKDIPLYWGLVNYFRDALIAVAKLSMIGNEQHNPGEKLRWAREKGGDELDAQMRHVFEIGGIDVDLVPHSVKNAWRALAVCQLELEQTPWTTTVAETIELMRRAKEPDENCVTQEDGSCIAEGPCMHTPLQPDETWRPTKYTRLKMRKTQEQWVVIETLGSPSEGNIRGYGTFPSKEAAQSYGMIVHRASSRQNFCSVMRVNDVKNIRTSR